MGLFRRRSDLADRVGALEAALAAERDERARLLERLEVAEQRQNGDEGRSDHDQLAARVEELSGALDNQLREVSGEVEAVRKHVDQRLAAADSLTAGRIAAFKHELEQLATDNGRVDELVTNQMRIANELARHEIAMHEELAAVADRLTRQRPSR
jgi:hypothetical protein